MCVVTRICAGRVKNLHFILDTGRISLLAAPRPLVCMWNEGQERTELEGVFLLMTSQFAKIRQNTVSVED